MKSRRPQKKTGPRTEFAWLVDEGVKAYQRQRRLPSLEIVQSEIAAEIAISVRTLQSWRTDRLPERYEDLQNFARICSDAVPELGPAWVTELFRAADMACYADRALSDLDIRKTSTETQCHLLRDYYIQPDAIFQRVRIEEFVGREWLTARVDQFLNDSARRSGALILTGETGIGKTTFLAHLVKQRQYLHLFAEQASGDANVQRALQSLMAQLIGRYHLEPYAASQTWPESLNDHIAFERVLRLAASRLRPSERIVIVCDALNEAGIVPGGNVLGLPAVLPDGVYLILSHALRPTRLHFRFVPQTVWLDPASADNLRDIRTYLHRVAQQPEMAWWLVVHQCSPDDFVQRLLDRSGGIWLYLSHLVAEIRGGHQGLSEPSRLPAGLANYFAEHAARWRGRDATKWDAVYAPVFATLAAAREPITLDQLMHWAGVKTSRHEIKRLLREAWRPVILEHEDPQRGTVYALYHHSLCEFAAGSVDRSRLSITGLYLMDDLQAQTREAHRRIVEYFRQQCDGDWSKLAGHAYVDRHLAHHLEKAQAPGTTPLRSRQQE